MKLLFGTLLGFFVTSCTVQDLSSYTNINSTESLEKKFEITPIDYYFYVTNNENEEQIIAFSDHHLYKFDRIGNLIDTLKFQEFIPTDMFFSRNELIPKNIQPGNYFIYSEDGYIPNWIKTGDKTKHQYHKVYNQDLTMDLDVMQQFEKMRKDAEEQYYKKDAIDSDEYDKRMKQCYDYLDERSELIKLVRTLNQQAKDKHKYFNGIDESIIFMINNEVIKVRIPNELKRYSNKIESILRYISDIPPVFPKFLEEQKSFHFEKEEWVERRMADCTDFIPAHWKGTAYYDLPIGESTLKIKVKDNRGWIWIDRNIFLGNKKFVLIVSSNKDYFIKEK